MTTFDARAWLAGRIGWQLSEVRRVGLIEQSADGTRRSAYRCAGQTARISIGPPWRTLRGDTRRLVLAHWDEGHGAATEIDPDDQVIW